MKTEKNKAIISLVLGILTFILVLKSVLMYFISTGDGNMVVEGPVCFRYFTIDSNILAAITCLCIVPFNIKAIRGKGYLIPRWAEAFKYVGTVAVMLTFLTVVFFLGPTQGYIPMFSGDCLWLHLVCPLFCLISYWFFEPGGSISFNESFVGLIPTVLYGMVYVFMVIGRGKENGGWEDFYGFNIGGFWYITIFVMLAATYLICFGVYKAKEKIGK